MIKFVARLTGLTLAFSVALLTPEIARAETSSSKVELISKGRGKKTKLRFHPKAGMVQIIRMISGQQISMKLGAAALPQQRLPLTEMVMVMRVDSVDKGRISGSLETRSVNVLPTPGVPGEMVAQMKAGLQVLEGLKGRMVFDERGQVLSAELDAPNAGQELASTLSNLRDNMNRIVVPLPKAAVGVGAKWRVTQDLAAMGMPITQEAIISLVARRGDVLTLSTDLIQRVGAGPVELPNVPPGLKVRTKPSSSKGKGRLLMDLTKVGAIGTIDMDVNVSMVMSDGQQNQSMDMAIKMNLEMKDGGAS